MVEYIWVSIGSGNGLLPDGTKPFPEAMLMYHQMCSVAFTWEQFPGKCSWYESLRRVWNLYYWNYWSICQGPMSWCMCFFVINPIQYHGCDYLYLPWSQINHVCKKGPCCQVNKKRDKIKEIRITCNNSNFLLEFSVVSSIHAKRNTTAAHFIIIE